MFKPSSRPHLKMEHGERRLGCQLTDFPHDHPRRSGLHSRSHICRPHPRLSSPSFWRVACPHPCIRPCRSRSSSPSSSPLPSPSASTSSPSTSCQHLHRSHLGYGPCVVTAAIVPLPSSPSPCRICRRRVVALIVVHAIIPILVIVLTFVIVLVLAAIALIALSPFPCFLFALWWRWLPTLCRCRLPASCWRWLPASCEFCVLLASTIGLVTLSRPKCVCFSCRLFVAYLKSHLIFLLASPRSAANSIYYLPQLERHAALDL